MITFESECEQQTKYILFTGAFYFNKLHFHTRRQLHVKYIKKKFLVKLMTLNCGPTKL